ncbi:MAG: TIGR03936 family radical SAM-associated protein [Sciscionella sp.]
MRYAKRGRLRFASARDIARAFERALRAAGVPMAYSQGFSPHPKISWIGAAPTGTASEAEFVEIGLVRQVDAEALRSALNAALPAGLEVIAAVPAGPGSLAERIDASRWRIALPGVEIVELRAAVAALRSADTVEVERLTKSGRRCVDVRPAIVSIEVSVQVVAPSIGSTGDVTAPTGVDMPSRGSQCGILTAVVRQLTPTVRPDDVLSALRVVAALTPPVPVQATRTAQGRLDDTGRLVDPLALDGPAVSASVVGEPERSQHGAE